MLNTRQSIADRMAPAWLCSLLWLHLLVFPVQLLGPLGRDMKLWPWLLGAICLVFPASLEEIGVFMAEKGFKHAAKLLRAPSTREMHLSLSRNKREPFGPRFRKTGRSVPDPTVQTERK